MKNLLFLLSLFCFLGLMACGNESQTDTTSKPSATPVETTNKPDPGQKKQIEGLLNPDNSITYTHCYRNEQAYANEENAVDIEELKLSFDGDVVKGVFNTIPAFKDHRRGKIEGMAHMSQVDGKYIFVQEGKIDTAKIKIILRNDHVIVYGEPVELGIGAEIEVVDCNN